jgi:hypothetical protein
MDIILYQRISGGWEYQYTSHCETYRGFADDPVQARARLLHQLGWDQRRFDRAQFRRF